MISRIIKVEVGVISRSRRLRLKTLTETLIILDITKTESNNNCFIIHSTEKKWSLSSTILLMSCSVNEANLEVIGSLSRRVFETRTATGREHFTCSGVSQIFVLIISNGEKILSNVNVVV